MKPFLMALLLSGCGGWFEDQAGGVAGPSVTVHCDNQRTLAALTPGSLTPGSVGDSTTKVNCPGANEAPLVVQPYEEARQ